MRKRMMRRNRLTIVIGFGLVLFVGILVSDHWSTANSQQAADLREPLSSVHVPALAAPGLVVYVDPNPTPVVETDAESSGVATTTSWPLHAIQRGETLASICLDHYGDSALASALAEVNGIDDPASIKTGRVVQIPDRRALLGGTLPPGILKPAAPAVAESPAVTRYATYTVQPGDTLSEIAQRLLHSARETQRLYELNRHVIRDPDRLTVGITLRYPAPSP